MFGLRKGSPVTLVARGADIAIRPAAPRPKLREMLRTVKKNNIHKLVNWGKPVGKEVW